MTAANNKRVYVRCPWCSRQPIALKRGLLVSHVTSGNARCVGTGQRITGTAFDPKK